MAFIRQFQLQVGHTLFANPITLNLNSKGAPKLPPATFSNTAQLAIDVSNLRCEFKVKKTSKPKPPNHAEIKIYGLSPDNQRFLETPKVLNVRLSAGYQDEGMSEIYVGEIFSGSTQTMGPECVTTLVTDDKGRKLQPIKINVSVGAGATIESVIRTMLGVMNGDQTMQGVQVGEGNLKATMAQLKALGVTTMHPRGGVISGYVATELTDLCQSVGLEWSIQDGNLYVTLANTATSGLAIKLSANTGLLGSPTVDNEGIVSARTVMIPGLKIGTKVNFDAKNLKGGFRVTDCTWTGDTHGAPWWIDFKGVRY